LSSRSKVRGALNFRVWKDLIIPVNDLKLQSLVYIPWIGFPKQRMKVPYESKFLLSINQLRIGNQVISLEK